MQSLTSTSILATRMSRFSIPNSQYHLGLATIKRAEAAENETSMTTANDLAVRRTLETAGVEFIDENGGGPGVRLRKRHQKKN
jgi:hypothetical protein